MAGHQRRRYCAEGGSNVGIYEIRVQGRLDQHWATWFDGMALVYEGDTTVLRGLLADDAALYGALAKVRDLHVRLLSVQAVELDGSAPVAARGGDSVAQARDASPEPVPIGGLS
jgi:hypothetical protein